MNTQDIRKEQEQVLAHAAERPSELFGLLDYIFDHANGDIDEAEAMILDEIKRWLRDMGKTIAGKKVQLKKTERAAFVSTDTDTCRSLLRHEFWRFWERRTSPEQSYLRPDRESGNRRTGLHYPNLAG